MKKVMLKCAALCLMLLSGVNAHAQLNLDNVLSSVSSATSSSSKDLVSNLTSVFSANKQASADKIVGTWSYTEPAIVFSSNNFLAGAAAKIAAGKIESNLQGYLSKYGITPGSMVMTFKEDGSFTENLKGKTVSGTWKVADNQLELTFLNAKTIPVTTQLSGSKLMFVTDATKLLTLMKFVAKNSGNSTLSTISSLMNSVKGMQAGLTLKKK